MPNRRSFWALTATQFLGALNDNIYKQFILLLALSVQVSFLPADAQPVASALFAVPFILFSLFAGSLADRYPKSSVIRWMKVLEIAVMAVGMLAFALNMWLPLNVGVAASMVVLFLMGAQSAFFAPSKYGIIPELVPNEKLSGANGIINMTTNLAIVAGTALAGTLNGFLQKHDLPHYYSGFIFVGIAVLGWAASLGIRPVPAADPARRLDTNIAALPAHAFREMRYLAPKRTLFVAMLANSWFCLLGVLAIMIFNALGTHVLLREADKAQGGSLLLAAVGLGIAAGSPLAGWLSGRRVELGLVPWAALGMGVAFGSLALCASPDDEWFAYGATFLAGVFGGIYLVPLSAYIQGRAGDDEKGRVLGALELMNFVFIFLAAVVYWLLQLVLGLGPRGMMLGLGIMTIAGAFVLCRAAPVFFQRAVLFVVIRAFYRLKVLHYDRVPQDRGVLYVANHVSFVDPMLVATAAPCVPRFLMHRSFTRVPLVGWLTRLLRVIPIADTDGPRALIRSLEEAAQHIQGGEHACIFAEGGITRTGILLPFSKGLERIAKRANVAIVPVYIDRMWGSLFSFKGGRFFFKRMPKLRYRVTVAFGEPLASDTPAYVVRRHVQELGVEAMDERKGQGETLATRFLRYARAFPRRLAMVDANKRELSYRKTLIGVLVLRNLLRRRLAGETHVGVLLPTGCGAALTNLALAVLGKIAVNLNFTAGPDAMAAAVEQCQLRTIITAKRFLEKIAVEPNSQHLDLETLLANATLQQKIWGTLLALLPGRALQHLPGVPRNPDHDVTVIFSSGSTGIPKGVQLTHHNILTNVRGLSQVFDPRPTDRIIGLLPFFHSFGYTATLWLPMTTGFTAVYHSNPGEAKTIAELTREYRGTIFIATPTFYQTYLRRFAKEDFATVRLAAAGAEKLKGSLREQWEEKFGTTLLEGYGCTELSPVVSINLPDIVLADVRQRATKHGTIGHPIPGIAAKIVETDTFTELPPNTDGMLLIKGANVMRGYLGQPDKTLEVVRDGWYVTGDVGRIDEDGFITLTGRLSRFSKIGGEMVPHLRVEEEIQAVIDRRQPCTIEQREAGQCGEAAVTSVPDETKGEKLVVLHTPLSFTIKELADELSTSRLPKLWIPRTDAFVEVNSIPKLGTGKLDLRAIKLVAEAHFAPKPADTAHQNVNISPT